MYALWNSLGEADQRDFNMDPLSIDWPHYAHDIQLPSTVKMARLKMQPSRVRRSTATSGSARMCCPKTVTSPSSTSRTP